MRIKMILPSLTEATSPFFRPVKYSLFPPLGLASLAAHCSVDDEIELVDEHTQTLTLHDRPDLVCIEVYITNARRAWAIADHYRARGVRVIVGGLHVTSLPEEAEAHADSIFIGPADHTFPQFLADLAAGRSERRYIGTRRTLVGLPPPRRDLIDRGRYLVPNSLVVSRGCPHSCDFCYKDGFFAGGKSFYVQAVDEALAEIERLPGRHLYFLDDHLLGNRRFAEDLFEGMTGMGRLFQGAATVDSVLRGDLIERAAGAGLRSIFLGFETLNPASLKLSSKHHNMGRDYDEAIRRLDDLGVMINGSFVFGLDGDGPDVFERTVQWAVSRGITTATFHIATPYPGTAFYRKMQEQGRITTRDWDLYDTRHVVFEPKGLTPEQLRHGYDGAYDDFYRWRNIGRSALQHNTWRRTLRHFAYTGAWKRFEPMWDLVIRSGALGTMRPLLESLLRTTRTLAGEPQSTRQTQRVATQREHRARRAI